MRNKRVSLLYTKLATQDAQKLGSKQASLHVDAARLPYATTPGMKGSNSGGSKLPARCRRGNFMCSAQAMNLCQPCTGTGRALTRHPHDVERPWLAFSACLHCGKQAQS